jgi:hypothetical protein
VNWGVGPLHNMQIQDGQGQITPWCPSISNSELCWKVEIVAWLEFTGGLRTFSVFKLQVAKDTLMFGPSWVGAAGCPSLWGLQLFHVCLT